MDVATISANGQITVLADVRRRLQLKAGDKIVFVENEYGDIVVRPAAVAPLEVQRAFRGGAKSAGFATEEEVDDYVAEVRTERGGRIPA